MTISSNAAGGPAADRSIPRSRVRRGDASIDGRGRMLAAPAFLRDGFRPFFLGGAVYAALAVPLWLWMFQGGAEPAGPFDAIAWHAHEMIFGYLGAVMAGFILTAVPNWTGRLPLSGAPLALLFGLWIAGRLASAIIGAPVAALVIDLAFPAALAAAVWREVVAGRNWKNVPVAVLLTLFAAASLLDHVEGFRPELGGTAVRLALAVAVVLMALIGGRIVPSFTRNWLVKQGREHLPAPFGPVDRAAIAVTVAAMLAWTLAPAHAVAGWLMVAAGLMLLVRLARWRGVHTWREPIVAVLHLGYLWLGVSVAMLGLSVLLPDRLPESAALHALTAGAIATMTLAVMTRATRGHTGRAIEADRTTIAIYGAVTAGALLRVAAPLLPHGYLAALTAGGVLWSLAFVLFAVHYGPMLLTPRR